MGPTVEGKVIASGIADCQIQRGKGGPWEHVAVIVYEFDGGSGINREVGKVSDCALKAVAEYDVAQHPVGKSLQVRFNPENPSEGTLRVETDTARYYVGFGLSVLISMPFLGVGVFRLRRSLAARR